MSLQSDAHPPVYVLIGGQSRRFGTDKATHSVEGVPWAIDVGCRLAPAGDFVFVGQPRTPGVFAQVRTIADWPGGVGPLAGVIAALEDRLAMHGPGTIVIASCDLVRPHRDLLIPLLEAIEADRTLDAAAYRAADLWQPFPAVLHTRLLDRAIDVAAEGGALQRLFAQRAYAAPWSAHSAGPPQANSLTELAEHLAAAAPSKNPPRTLG
ncbi:molybdenum cofactor guanylyltransferase [Botrimarina hoheduenensis]|uniref:Molybdopterin-guanine dinucleotide biosynthesis protein MobA n=1 Tax=Botrimarina hoheduenensis TaxID=2528000 RepID=A0A5C5WC89_9BACT|nr:NTP transferase domain-containing protein [Botrimarina hoheduenensis]TWT47709.1 molybdopterin-guanine dinucleotide biosynthesis protein MobA [Botrimarina hoheduenensis]